MNDPILFNILGILQTTLLKNEHLPFTAMKKEDNSYQPLDGSNIAKVKIMSIACGYGTPGLSYMEIKYYIQYFSCYLGVVFIIWSIPDNIVCKYILIYSTYLIICSSFFIILCTFIIIWGALNIICGSSNIIFGKYYNMLCAFQSIWCTYYHYDDDDRSNIMSCTFSVLFGSLCNPWWRTNNIICSTFFFMMMIFRKLLFGVLVKWVVKPGPGREVWNWKPGFLI